MKTILITGASGFIGSHAVEWYLKNTDYKIIALVRNYFAGSFQRFLHFIPAQDLSRIKFVWHNLRDSSFPPVKEKVDYILHLAASSHVDRSIANPREFVLDNVLGTCNLLEYYKTLQSQARFLYFSTDEVFGPASQDVGAQVIRDYAEEHYSKELYYDYQEWDRYNSSNPYAATKAGAEELCLAYANTYKLDIFITHTMNVIGERQHPEKVLPKFIQQILDNVELEIHSNHSGKAASRFFIYAKEVIRAIYFLFEKAFTGEKYNIVGERELNALQLAQCIGSHLGISDFKYKLTQSNLRPGHDPRYALDGTKLKEIGFKFKQHIDQSIQETVHWYSNNPEWLTGTF